MELGEQPLRLKHQEVLNSTRELRDQGPQEAQEDRLTPEILTVCTGAGERNSVLEVCTLQRYPVRTCISNIRCFQHLCPG